MLNLEGNGFFKVSAKVCVNVPLSSRKQGFRGSRSKFLVLAGWCEKLPARIHYAGEHCWFGMSP